MTTTVTLGVGGHAISADLWGIFFEDINSSADGGLYAELIQNRSFSYTGRDAPGWGPLTAWRAIGPVTVCDADPLSAATPHYARLGGGNEAAVENDGFGGIRLIRGETYDLVIHARTAQATTATVTLTAPDASTARSMTFNAGAHWRRYETTFVCGFDTSAGGLRIAVEAGDTVDLAFVSLFPRAVFRNAPNGMRRDLAEAIAELSPQFIRFPGGCVAHGLGLDNMYRWPTTLGDVELRTQDTNVWGYHQSMGIGYLEYFRLCEQLGATALPVVAAGVCCQNTLGGPQAVADAEMPAYIREVLDLVEFANGDPDSKWGGLRARLGHPKSFDLRYLAIGNEDQIDDVFRNRFTRIHAAVAQRYPDIQIIGTAGPAPFGADFDEGWRLARQLGVDLVDEHSYKSPKWLFENVHRYDQYDRRGPGVYVGEYGSRGNTFLNALAEAAYMTGLERNADIVRLASYAPLLAKVDSTQWVPDLIYFDSARVLPSLNYYVQQMFASSAGATAVPVSVVDPPVYVRHVESESTVALAAQGFTIECSDLRVNGVHLPDVRIADDSTPRRLDITPVQGRLLVELAFTAVSGDADRGQFAVQFGALDSPDSREINLGTWLNRSLTMFGTSDGFRDEMSSGVPFTIELGRTYSLRIDVDPAADLTMVWIDGIELLRYLEPSAVEHRFVASAVRDPIQGREYVRIVNATGRATSAVIAASDGDARAIVSARQLAGPPDAGAPFEAAPFLPIDLPPATDGSWALPGYSLTIIELDPSQ